MFESNYSKEILLNVGMKCWNSAFNAQGSRVIIVVVQVGAVKIYVAEGSRVIIVVVHVGAVKIYVAEVQAPRKKEPYDETQLNTEIGGKN